MKILLLTRYLAEGVGGAELVFTLLAKYLASHGHKVWVITNKIEGVLCPTHENIKIIFVDTHTISDVKHWKQYKKISYNLSAIKIGLSLIKNEKIDLIHSNPIQPTLAGSILSILSSKPHIVTIHDVTKLKKIFLAKWSEQEKNSQLKASIGSAFSKFIIRFHHDAVHTVSESVCNDLKALGEKKPIYVIHNAIPITEPKKIPLEPFQFVHIGRLVFYKNVQIVIEAINLIKESYPKVRLVIIGEGQYSQTLKNLVSDLNLENNIIFKGRVTEDEKNKLVASSVALVFPSFYEGFGMVILDAFLQKKPVLVSNVRPMSDIVEDKKTGLIISENKKEEWAKAMKSLLAKPELAIKMGESGRITLEEKFNLELMGNQILKMYKNFYQTNF